MHIDSEYINIQFHNRAKEVFFLLLKEFESSVSAIDRTKNEYLFQQGKEKYLNTFKRNLQLIAEDLIRENQQNEQINDINTNLNSWIDSYLHLFVQKIRTV
jgi:hypothetical protein